MKRIAEKLAFQFTGIYTAVTVLFSFCMAMEGAQVVAIQYLKLFLMFAFLWLITLGRCRLDQCQWGLRQHYLLKRLLFMPIYLGITLWTLLHFGDPFQNSAEDAGFIAVVFLTGFAVSLIIGLPRARRQEQQYDDMLKAYQKQLREKNE